MPQQPTEPASHGQASYATFLTPWGEGVVGLRDAHLLEIDLPDPAEGRCPRPERGLADHPSDTLQDWVTRLQDYLRSGRPTWTDTEAQEQVETIETTPFRRAVYSALLSVPAGETVSYGELAAMAGYPGAARAVGSAMAANPLALIVPCHRVVRSDGSLGHYGRCDACKGELLALERAEPMWPAREAGARR